MKIYYGMNVEEGRTMCATVTGEMVDGTLVYTQIETTEDGAIIRDKNGEPKLILDNQFTRRLRHGWQSFHRI